MGIVIFGVFGTQHLAGLAVWPGYGQGQPESGRNCTSACVWLHVPVEPSSEENVFVCLYRRSMATLHWNLVGLPPEKSSLAFHRAADGCELGHRRGMAMVQSITGEG